MRVTAEGYLPTDRWRSGEYIRETFEVTLPAEWAELPGDGVGLAVALSGQGGKVDVTGQVASSDPHQAVLGVTPLTKPAMPIPSNDAGVAPAPLQVPVPKGTKTPGGP